MNETAEDKKIERLIEIFDTYSVDILIPSGVSCVKHDCQKASPGMRHR